MQLEREVLAHTIYYALCLPAVQAADAGSGSEDPALLFGHKHSSASALPLISQIAEVYLMQ